MLQKHFNSRFVRLKVATNVSIHINQTVYEYPSITYQSILSIYCIRIMTHTPRGRDPEGLRCFYYLIQDLKCFVFALIGMHFKIKPIAQ